MTPISPTMTLTTAREAELLHPIPRSRLKPTAPATGTFGVWRMAPRHLDIGGHRVRWKGSVRNRHPH